MVFIKKKKKKIMVGLFSVFLPLFLLSACGDSVSPYTLKLETGASASYQFAEDFRENSFGIYDGTKRLAYVTTSMLENFHTNVLTFGVDLPLKVLYEGRQLKSVYQVSSSYALDKDHYTVKISYEQLEVTGIGNPSKTDTEFQIPSYSETLPAPLNSWPITAWSASFGGMSSLKKVTLSPVLKSFNPTPLSSTIALFPYSTIDSKTSSKIDYQGDFLYLSSALAGIRPTLQGTLTLPDAVDHFWGNAFAAPLPSVTAVELNEKYTDMDFTSLSKNLPANQAFILDTASHGYFVQNAFLYYNDGTDISCRGIPEGKAQSGTSLTLPSGLTRFHLSNLDGFVAPGSAHVIFPNTLTSFSAPAAIDNTTLTSLEFTSSSLVRTNALSIKNLPSTLASIKVPSSLLSTYQSDSVWGKVASLLVA